jgi:hypothetical protein
VTRGGYGEEFGQTLDESPDDGSDHQGTVVVVLATVDEQTSIAVSEKNQFGIVWRCLAIGG